MGVDLPAGRQDPAHESLSNTFRMHQKLNDSYEDGISDYKSTKTSLNKSLNAPEGTLLRDLWSGYVIWQRTFSRTAV